MGLRDAFLREMMSIRIEIAAKTNSQLGEGAFWDVHQKCLWWVDIVSGLIHKYCPNNEENETYDFNEPSRLPCSAKNGGLVLAAKSGFWLFDPETGLRTAILDPEEHMPENRFNDGATDMQGRFWAGTMKDGSASEQVGAFYRLDPDLSVTKWRDGFFTTNGMAFFLQMVAKCIAQIVMLRFEKYGRMTMMLRQARQRMKDCFSTRKT